MASVVDDSVASLPPAHLAQLRAELMLDIQLDSQLATGERATPPLEAQHAPARDDIGNAVGCASAAPEVDLPIATIATQEPAAGLAASTSAMPAPLLAPPSQAAVAPAARAASFHGYPGGDTQPMESQVYREFNTSILRPGDAVTPMKPNSGRADASKSPNALTMANGETCATTATEKTPKTCVEGETGFIDVVDGYQPSPLAQSQSPSPSIWGQDEPAEELWTDGTAQEVNGSLARPAVPETPAAAGHTRGSNGELLTSGAPATTKTPGFSQFFGGHGAGAKADLLSATQLFHQTQAPSSPLPGVLLSDPVVSRPSPNVLHHFSVSSPEITLSSPVATMPARSSTLNFAEPRGSYTSMRESQEQHRQAELRAARLRKGLGLHQRFGGVDDAEDDDDEYGNEFDRERLRFEQKRLKRTVSDQALNDFARVPALSRLASTRKSGITIDLVTSPAVQPRADRVEFEFSEDGDHTDVDEEVVAEDEGDRNVIEDHDDGGDDVYDELGQIVLRSQSHDLGATADDDSVDAVDEERIQGTGEVDAPPELNGTAHGTHDAPLVLDGDEPDAADVEESQHMAVADSQPERPDGGPNHHTPAHSSMASFIPGSQYTGRTSQDQARHSKIRVAEGLSQRLDTNGGADRQIPSSPPLLGDNLDPSTNAIDELRNSGGPEARDDAPVNEVPESDLLAPTPSNHNTDTATLFETAHQTESHSAPPFSTAKTHASSNDPQPPGDPLSAATSPFKRLAREQSRSSSSQTPRKAAGVRHFSQIADSSPAAPTSLLFHTSTDSQLDLDALIGDVLTADDHVHIQAMSSPQRDQPPPKRRSLARGKAVALWPETRHDAASESAAAQINPPRGRHTDVDVDAAANEPSPVDGPAETPTMSKALRSSPSKANEMAAATPPVNAVTEDVSGSARKRERAGARAASQLVAKRGKPATKVSARAESKKAPLPAALTSSRVGKLKAKAKPPAVSRPVEVKGRAGGRSAKRGKGPAVHTTEAPPSPAENVVMQASGPPEIQPVVAVEDQSALPVETAEPGAIPAATYPRVFAIFRGSNNYFYPATWVSSSPDGKTQCVRFDDGVETSVEAHLVCSLDLRLNDIVKVDMSGMRTKSWVVKGFGETDAEARTTDVYGHRIVKVQMKAVRASLAAGTADLLAEGDVIDVEVEKIYLPSSMWEPFRARSLTPLSREGKVFSRAATPTSRVPSLNGDTPTSRSRRTTLTSVRPQVGLPQLLREGSTSSSATGSEKRVFHNMAFAISYGGNDAEKAEVTRLILSHGGQILERGFDELFDLPDLTDSVEIGPPDTLDDVDAPAQQQPLLHLKSSSEGIGFVALIADRHSRREKYIQALALGLPTLSGRWIIDSLDPSKNTTPRTDEPAPLPWAKYLLPAGESSYLGGAVRSRTLDAFPTSSSHPPLAAALAARRQLLAAAGVLIVVPKKGRPGGWERRRTFIFLALALGAGRVRRVADLAEAQAALASGCSSSSAAEDDRWQWLFTDGPLADARAALLPRHQAPPPQPGPTSKKRKFGAAPLPPPPPQPRAAPRTGEVTTAAALSVSHGRVRVVNDEFVVQSLVLGDLVD